MVKNPVKILTAAPWLTGTLQSDLRVQSAFTVFDFQCLSLATSRVDERQVWLVLGVVVQLALYRLATFDGENSLRFRKVDEIQSHPLCHFRIRLNFSDFHLSHGTLDHMIVFQR